jgi:hypothetical protein
MTDTFTPGTYTKGDHSRVVETAADYVQATFDGYQLKDEASTTDGEETPAPSAAPTPDVDNGSPAGFTVDGDTAATYTI